MAIKTVKGKVKTVHPKRRTQWVLLGLAVLAACPLLTDAADRRFLVILANPTKTFPNGVPPEGLTNRALINAQYFDANPFNNIRSFAEFWEEISYGNVTVSGDTRGWISLPWPLAPPNDPDGNLVDPDFASGNVPDLNLSGRYEYGAGELFAEDPLEVNPPCTFMCSGVAIDYNGSGNADRARFLGTPADAFSGIQLDLPDDELPVDPECPCCAIPVDEPDDIGSCLDREIVTDPLGGGESLKCPDRDAQGNCPCPVGFCFFPVPHNTQGCRAGTEAQCNAGCGSIGFDAACRAMSMLRCMESGGTWVTEPDRFFPPCIERCPDDRGIDDGSDEVSSRGKLTVGPNIPSLPLDDGIYSPGERFRDVNQNGRYDALHEPRWRLDGSEDRVCDDENTDDFFDIDGNGQRDLPEPFEDHMIRWDPSPAPDGAWVPVDEDYVRSNYPLNTNWNVRDSIDDFFSTQWGWNCNARNTNPLEEDTACVYFKQQMYVLRVFPSDQACNVASNTCIGHPSVSCESDAECDFVRDDLEGVPLGDFNQFNVFGFNDTAVAAWSNVEEMIWRGGNGVYDPPERWENVVDGNGDEISTKMQHAHRFDNSAVPEPGTYVGSDSDSVKWFEPFWAGRYGTQPPRWGHASPTASSPIMASSPLMVPFDPQNPGDPGPTQNEPRRFFSNAGRLDLQQDSEDRFDGPIEPDSSVGFYDGWVEHDDLASSKYHAAGDQRLGEITSPFSPTSFTWDPEVGGTTLRHAIAGEDRGAHRADDVSGSDGRTVAAGPLAEHVHGNFGLDAGNVLILEWMTWRTNTPWVRPDVLATPVAGAKAVRQAGWTLGKAWNRDRLLLAGGGFRRHPYVSPGMGIGGDIDNDGVEDGYGFRDFNLDGLIDQGEVRPAGSGNYTTDVRAGTGNLGTSSDYPFNRRRLIEDCIAILDNSLDFDLFADTGTLRDHFERTGSQCPTLPSTECPDTPGNRDAVVSGIVLLPRRAFDNLGSIFPAFDPSFYPIHVADRRDPTRNSASVLVRPPYNAATHIDPDTQLSLYSDTTYLLGEVGVDVGFGDGVGFCESHGIPNEECLPYDHALWFHDMIAVLDRPAPLGGSDPAPGSDADADGGDPRYQIRYAAHRYGEIWNGFADLYSLERVDNPVLDVNPIGRWGLMADGDRTSGHPVHPVADLKVQAGWVDAVNLRTVLAPNTVQEITLADSEESNNATIYFYENPLNRGERFYFSRRGFGGQFGQFLPGAGLVILHTDFGNNPEARPEQQRLSPFSWNIMQADGRFDLDAGFNFGDVGDPFPGQSRTTVWNHFTFPTGAHNRWHGDGFSGIDIVNVIETPTGTRVSFVWTPIEVPAMLFDEPPGSMRGDVFNINFLAFDQFAGSEIRIFFDDDLETLYDSPVAINQTSPFRKQNAGTLEAGSVTWDLTDGAGNDLPDGLYYFYGKVDPSPDPSVPGAEGQENAVSPVLASINNGGDGVLTGPDEDFAGGAITSPGSKGPLVNPPKVRLEGWTATCIDAAGTTWAVEGSLSGELTARAQTDMDYLAVTDSGEELVRFRIRKGTGKFILDDQFTFITTGLTEYSNAVNLRNGEITNAPIAVICASCAVPLSGDPPLVVTLDGRASIANGARDLSYSWTFGDGSPSAIGPEVTHTFEFPGNFVVSLTVSDIDDAGSQDTAEVEIRVSNGAPTADLEAVVLTADFSFPFDVQFSAAGSNDPENLPLTYFWDFDDRRGSTSTQEIPPRHRYFEDPDNPGPYTVVVTLEVTDSAGEKDVTFVTLTPGNSPPSAQFTTNPPSGVVPLAVAFDAGGSSDAQTSIGDLEFEWDFGDPGSGTANTATGVTALHTFDDEGDYKVRLTVRDTDNGETTTSRTVVGLDPSVAGEVPTAVIVPLTAVAGPAPLNVTVDAGSSSDPQNDALTYSWNFGDPNSGNLNTATTVLADHTYGSPGTYTISLTVNDGSNSGLATLQVTVTGEDEDIENRPPSASFIANPSQGVAPLTVAFNASGSSDPDGDTLNFFWDFGDGEKDAGLQVVHTYLINGTYEVTMTAVDSGNLTASSSITISVGVRSNRNPIARLATYPAIFSAPDDFAFDGNLSSDPDGDALSYTWQITDQGVVTDFGFDLVGARLLMNFRATEAECNAVTGPCLAEGSYAISLTVGDDFGGLHSTGPLGFSVVSGPGGPILDSGPEPGADVPDDGVPLTGTASVTSTGLCGLGTWLPLMMLGLTLTVWMAQRRRR